MNEKVEEHIRKLHPDLARFFLLEGEGLESEGWTISIERGLLTFETPMLAWWGSGVVSTSRYKMTMTKTNWGWHVIALDPKPHWPTSFPHHPNLRPTSPCMGNADGVLRLPNPFVAARSIASMLAGKVYPKYQAWRYGDQPFNPVRCACCNRIIYPNRRSTEVNSLTYHKTCWEKANGKAKEAG